MEFALKILSIGNSFSRDATCYVHQIAKSSGVDLLSVNLYIGGCSLEQHWQNVLQNAPAYQVDINGEETEKHSSIESALKSQKWDYVTLQQVSNLSTDYSTYQPYLGNLVEFVKKHAPGAEIVIHQTWAYEEGSERLYEIAGYKKQELMFRDLEAAYLKAAEFLGGARIIPCGWVFQQFLKRGFRNLHRDTFHASIPQGRYILAAVWYEFFTGKNVSETTFCPEGLAEEEWNYLKEQVHSIFNGA